MFRTILLLLATTCYAIANAQDASTTTTSTNAKVNVNVTEYAGQGIQRRSRNL